MSQKISITVLAKIIERARKELSQSSKKSRGRGFPDLPSGFAARRTIGKSSRRSRAVMGLRLLITTTLRWTSPMAALGNTASARFT
jgi:hypothetical protein